MSSENAPTTAAPHGPDFVAPDGSIQVTRADYPGAHLWSATPAPAATPDTLTADDILAVRGIVRVDPPVDEDWMVVTFVIKDRWGDAVQQIRRVNLGGRVFEIDTATLPAERPAAVEASPEAPSPAPVARRAASDGKNAGKDESARGA